jgi:hypothetical protein
MLLNKCFQSFFIIWFFFFIIWYVFLRIRSWIMTNQYVKIPRTGRHVPIRVRRHCSESCNYGFDFTHYQNVTQHKLIWKIFNLRRNSWETISFKIPRYRNWITNDVFLNGVCYWIWWGESDTKLILVS